jgi:hypothetical protein
MGHWRPRGGRRPLRNERRGVLQADASTGVGLAGVVTPQKRNKAARNRNNWQKKRVGNVLDDNEEPALLGVKRARRSAKKAETEGRAPSAKKAGRTAVRARAKAKAIKEIDLEEWATKGHRPGRAPIVLGRRKKRPRTKRRASTPVKGGPQDHQGNVCNDASAAMTPAL